LLKWWNDDWLIMVNHCVYIINNPQIHHFAVGFQPSRKVSMFFDCTYIYINILNTKLKKQQYVWYKKNNSRKKLRETTELFFLTWTSKLDWSCHCNTSLLTLAKCRKSEPTIWGMDCLAICKVRNVAISSSLNMANLR